MSDWIPIDEDPPTGQREILVAYYDHLDNPRVTEATVMGGEIVGFYNSDITHWKPKPTHPDELETD